MIILCLYWPTFRFVWGGKMNRNIWKKQTYIGELRLPRVDLIQKVLRKWLLSVPVLFYTLTNGKILVLESSHRSSIQANPIEWNLSWCYRWWEPISSQLSIFPLAFIFLGKIVLVFSHRTIIRCFHRSHFFCFSQFWNGTQVLGENTKIRWRIFNSEKN